MDNDDKRHNHGLIVWDGDPQTVIHPDIELDEDVIGEAVVVVYDITNPSSFDEAKHHAEKYWLQRRRAKDHVGIEYWLQEHLESCDVVCLVGSKADLWKQRKIKYEVLSCYNYIHVTSMEPITLLCL